jgi:hypothetical protein
MESFTFLKKKGPKGSGYNGSLIPLFFKNVKRLHCFLIQFFLTKVKMFCWRPHKKEIEFSPKDNNFFLCYDFFCQLNRYVNVELVIWNVYLFIICLSITSYHFTFQRKIY